MKWKTEIDFFLLSIYFSIKYFYTYLMFGVFGLLIDEIFFNNLKGYLINCLNVSIFITGFYNMIATTATTAAATT